MNGVCLPCSQLLYKQAAGKMVLHSEGGTLSLLCPLRHPPKFSQGKRRQGLYSAPLFEGFGGLFSPGDGDFVSSPYR